MALSKEFERIGEELMPLAERVVKGAYATDEGQIADARRLCELAQAVYATVRTRALMEWRARH
jgi:hypothetical protein